MADYESSRAADLLRRAARGEPIAQARPQRADREWAALLRRPVAWLPFEPVEVDTVRRRVRTRRTDPYFIPSAVQGVEPLLEAYEAVYLEKERLRKECEELRKRTERTREQAPSGRVAVQFGAVDARTEEQQAMLKSLHARLQVLVHDLHTLIAELAKFQEGDFHQTPARTSAASPHAAEPPAAPASNEGEVKREPEPKELAKVVAEWVFPDPSEAQIRLVEVALRGQMHSNHRG